MNPRNLTREAIEQLNDTEPYCFETDREEQWFNVGLQYGLDVADSHPKSPWISTKEDLPCNHEELLKAPKSYRTKAVIVRFDNNMHGFLYMTKIHNKWEWYDKIKGITHWMPIPELSKE